MKPLLVLLTHYAILLAVLLAALIGLMGFTGNSVQAGERAILAYAVIGVTTWLGLAVSLYLRLPDGTSWPARLGFDAAFLVVGWPTLAVAGFIALIAFNR
ncbi:MAG: hypothetical protein HYV17_07320 [Xanthomonadales bacterium]|nr:hypothetical protein [Xanthomonadales bacterium]